MTTLAGAAIVLPERTITSGALDMADGRITGIRELEPGDAAANGADVVRLDGLTLVPGFIDVHVHGIAGIDVLDDGEAVARVAAMLPRYGVTAFCPTSVACPPAVLRRFLDAVSAARSSRVEGAARVLPAHLESNFINPAWAGAQPVACLRACSDDDVRTRGEDAAFDGEAILRVIDDAAGAVAIVTIAPELPGGLALVRRLRDAGVIVSIGHSGATYDEARAAIAAGVTHATHLFNRMSPLTHRQPGVVGAVLESREVMAELICDGHHVHPGVVALTLATKGVDRVMAITDGTAASGLPVGTRATLGGQPIVAGERSAHLEDGTLAGSRVTMDEAFRVLLHEVRVPLATAVRLCATTPANQLGLTHQGRLSVGMHADVVAIDAEGRVRYTWIGGQRN